MFLYICNNPFTKIKKQIIMKILLIAITLFIGANSFAQGNIDVKSEKPQFKCDLIEFDSEQNTFELTGNVSLKTEIIELENAEKIVFDKSTNEIIVSGLKDFTIDGSIQVSEEPHKRILRYKIGERIAYVE